MPSPLTEVSDAFTTHWGQCCVHHSLRSVMPSPLTEAYSHSLIGLWPGRVGYDSGRALHVHTYIMYVRHMHLTCNSRTRKAAWGFFDAFIWSIFNILCNIFRYQECLIYLIGYKRQLLPWCQFSCGSERAIVSAAQSDCSSKPGQIF